MMLFSGCCRRSSSSASTSTNWFPSSTKCFPIGWRTKLTPLRGGRPMAGTKMAPKIGAAKAPLKTLLRTPDLLSVADLSPREFAELLALAELVKARPRDYRSTLAGKQVVLIFEKPSLRTRVTFQAGIASLGGTPHFLDQRGEAIDAREPLRDVARN